ncbi:hypothetical protein HanXRQr2_Chr06g0257821 [Helianthus annuus]|uniref:Uncharacterized protein n=1 Tax=Helianthus annuus TaxID=4232 RepID=A0A9K3ISJ0_HELAN|nr:hypothetical protein HanXRQr2_Chr06g0257821 [Helianthus annuus]
MSWSLEIEIAWLKTLSLRALHIHQHLVENIACNAFLCNVGITMCSEMSRISTIIGGRKMLVCIITDLPPQKKFPCNSLWL